MDLQEIWVQSQGWEDPLEKGMATHSSILVNFPGAWTDNPSEISCSCKNLPTYRNKIPKLSTESVSHFSFSSARHP